MPEKNKYRGLVWACRRGMLELDYMIMPFYQEQFSILTDEQKEHFSKLLNLPDPELFKLLMRQDKSPDKGRQEMIDLIRDHLASK